MKVVLTGASGFIGAEIARQLQARGVETHVLGRRPVAGLPFHYCDLLADDFSTILSGVGASHLLHSAWHDDRATLWNGWENLEWVAASLRLVLAFRRAGGQRAVVTGSCAEYSWSQSLLDERTSLLEPASVYGRAKLALFELLTKTESLAPLSLGWARVFFPFGPDDKPDRLLSAVIDGVADGKPVACSRGEQVRPFIYVEDAAAAMIALLNSDVSGAVNIALDEGISVRELAFAAAAMAGDPSLLRFGGSVLKPEESRVLTPTTARLFTEVGFIPRYTIREGVALTVKRRLGR